VPARFRDFKRWLESQGMVVEPGDGTSHYRVVNPATGALYTIPAHNGFKQELSDIYLKACCKAHGLSFQAFKKQR
jgi:hypothetical protein